MHGIVTISTVNNNNNNNKWRNDRQDNVNQIDDELFSTDCPCWSSFSSDWSCSGTRGLLFSDVDVWHDDDRAAWRYFDLMILIIVRLKRLKLKLDLENTIPCYCCCCCCYYNCSWASDVASQFSIIIISSFGKCLLSFFLRRRRCRPFLLLLLLLVLLFVTPSLLNKAFLCVRSIDQSLSLFNCHLNYV